MGKRSNFDRNPRDFYPTPYEAVVPLFPHLANTISFDEPCAGDGTLVKHLVSKGLRNGAATDIEPRADWITKACYSARQNCSGNCFITNPPWDREILHPLITHLSSIALTWLLIDADWAYTKQSSPFMRHCRSIVAVGRVKWIPGSKMTGKDNCAWYLFDHPAYNIDTRFYGR